MATQELKYKTLAELRLARQLGETDAVLTIDNDTVFAYEHDGEGDKVWEAYPDDVLTQALDLLGIPHEGV